jgi:hypothetical protein
MCAILAFALGQRVATGSGIAARRPRRNTLQDFLDACCRYRDLADRVPGVEIRPYYSWKSGRTTPGRTSSARAWRPFSRSNVPRFLFPFGNGDVSYSPIDLDEAGRPTRAIRRVVLGTVTTAAVVCGVQKVRRRTADVVTVSQSPAPVFWLPPQDQYELHARPSTDVAAPGGCRRGLFAQDFKTGGQCPPRRARVQALLSDQPQGQPMEQVQSDDKPRTSIGLAVPVRIRKYPSCATRERCDSTKFRRA